MCAAARVPSATTGLSKEGLDIFSASLMFIQERALCRELYQTPQDLLIQDGAL